MRKLIPSLALFALASGAQALTVTGLTFTVAADSDYPVCCGVTPGSAQLLNQFNDYFQKGFAEFDLAGQEASTSPVYLSFTATSIRADSPIGLTSSYVAVDTYAGNNAADQTDFRAPSRGGQFTFKPLPSQVGQVFSFDVTSSFNSAVASSLPSLGFRLGLFSNYFLESYTFQGFQLSDAASPVAAVPEPEQFALLLIGLPVLLRYAASRRGSGTIPAARRMAASPTVE